MSESLHVKIQKLSNCTPEEQAFILSAIKLQEIAFKTLNFRHRFEQTKFAQSNGLTGADIYQKIMTGVSKITDFEDKCIDYALEVYNGNGTGTIAYTSMSTGKIFINRLVLKNWMKKPNGVAYCASSLFHEYLHTMGFKHSYWPLGTKRKSVPYKGGEIMRDIVLLYLSNNGSTTFLRK